MASKSAAPQADPSLLEDDAFVPNATFKRAPKRVDAILEAVEFVFKTARRDADGTLVRSGRPVSISGTHGAGKSSAVKDAIAKLGARAFHLSLPSVEVSDFYLPIPKRLVAADEVTQARWMLEMHIHQGFKPAYPGEEFVVVFDDYRRANPSVFSALFEITNEGTLTGMALDGLIGVVCIDNPVGEGYMNVRGGDIAFESRFAHFPVTPDEILWREHLAAKFPDVDLTPIFQAFGKWDEKVSRIVCPRVIEHIAEVTAADLPPILGLPLMPSGRQRIIDAGGNDRTKEILQIFSSTFAKPYRERIPAQLETALAVAIEKGWNVHLVGGQGIGKTATIKALPERFEDLDLTLYSAANMAMGDLLAQVPADGKVESIVNERLVAKAGRRLLVAFDEGFRAPKNVKPQMLEVFQERSVGGVPMGGAGGDVVGVWMLNNPAKIGNLSFNVGAADEALCSRFTLNIEVTDEDTAWRDYLVSLYGDVAQPFLEWRAHSLKDDERAFISPRTLEVMIELYVHLGPDHIEKAIPVLGGQRLPVRLHELKARLDNKRVFGPKELFAEIDDVEAKLLGADGDVKEHIDLQDAVVSVLRKADLPELEPHADACARLVKALPSDIRISLIRTENPERQKFWTDVFAKTLV